MGFQNPTPIQAEVIPHVSASRQDLIALAHTGTGKTAAFGLPILNSLQEAPAGINALVLCPTRELAIQIVNELRAYAKNLPRIVIEAVYGGTGYGEQLSALKRGVHILVATPGRLLDLIEKKKAQLSNIEYLVLDEADIMLNMGFKEELDAILAATPEEKQSILLSATMPPEVARIASTYMKDPKTITSGQKNAAAESVEHFYFMVHGDQKYAALKRLVDFHPDMYGIVFCRTKASTQEIADRLVADGYEVESLHGDLTQMQREMVMRKFRRRDLQILVATDIAARGLDVQDLSHVIHYDLPDEIEVYTHRSGRTGRAGKEGTSYAIVGPRQKQRLLQIQRIIQREIQPRKVPKGEDIFERQLLDFAEKLVSTEAQEEQIQHYFEQFSQAFDGLDRDEILKKIVALQFEKLLEYYRDLPDMKPVHEKTGNKSKDHKKNRRVEQRKSRHGDEGFGRLRINLGKNQGIRPPDLIGLVNQCSRRRDIEIGHIGIKSSWSSIQVEQNYSELVAQAMDGFDFRGQKLRVELDTPQSHGDRSGRPTHKKRASKGKLHYAKRRKAS